MIQFFLIFGSWALLAFRIILGAILVTNGLPKLRKPKKTASQFEELGCKPGMLWARLVGLVEFVGGIFIIVGFLTQIFSFLVFLQLLATLFIVKRRAKFKGEIEFDLLILAGLFILITMGGGMLSLDQSLNFLIY